MHVLMLGWEFPPFITGGLGTACHGLTRAMDRRGTKVTFVLPRAVGAEPAEHVDLLSPQHAKARAQTTGPGEVPPTGEWIAVPKGEYGHLRMLGIPAGFVNPYQSTPGPHTVEHTSAPGGHTAMWVGNPAHPMHRAGDPESAGIADYGGDMIDQVERYARFCVAATRDLEFDVIHAHDWMTYPAGLMIARLTGKPLVVHVHSTEFDRSGAAVNQRIYDIERRGMHGALRVITVSQLTRNVVTSRYGVPPEHIEVVYNGVDLEPRHVGMTGIRSTDKIVLYFGRITYQKGPEYFVGAARRVLEYMDDVKFVVAGSGDQATHMIELAAEYGIGHKVLFTGFLRGDAIARVFSLADLYVMPSVSEPFGIAPLEAMGHNVPVLISKSSGVSEVLTHALKVDFWDTEDMANKIIAVLRHPPLSQTLQDHGAFEVRKITWDGAAARCEHVYDTVLREMNHLVGT